jgi:hypothetical protein
VYESHEMLEEEEEEAGDGGDEEGSFVCAMAA